jgi:hypothetical protein
MAVAGVSTKRTGFLESPVVVPRPPYHVPTIQREPTFIHIAPICRNCRARPGSCSTTCRRWGRPSTTGGAPSIGFWRRTLDIGPLVHFLDMERVDPERFGTNGLLFAMEGESSIVDTPPPAPRRGFAVGEVPMLDAPRHVARSCPMEKCTPVRCWDAGGAFARGGMRCERPPWMCQEQVVWGSPEASF